MHVNQTLNNKQIHNKLRIFAARHTVCYSFWVRGSWLLGSH